MTSEDLEFEPVDSTHRMDICKATTSGRSIFEITYYPNPFDFKTAISIYYDVWAGLEQPPEIDSASWAEDWDGAENYGYWYSFRDLEKAYRYAIDQEGKGVSPDQLSMFDKETA